MLDIYLLFFYVVAWVMVASKDSFACLIAFAAACLLGEVADYFEPWSYHCAMALIYALLACSVGTRAACVAVSITAFQYIMAWDAFAFPSSETVLYSVYAVVTFALNLILIFTIGKSGSEKNGRNHNAHSYRLPDLQPMAAHHQRMRKG